MTAGAADSADNRCKIAVPVVLAVLLVSAGAAASAPALPDFVATYFSRMALHFDVPQGVIRRDTYGYSPHSLAGEPWSVSADFNGDAITDWAGLLRSPEGRLKLVAVLSFRKGFLHQVLTDLGADSSEIPSGVFLVDAGAVDVFAEGSFWLRPTIELEHPGIRLVRNGRSVAIFYRLLDRVSFQAAITPD